jgi:hypothetical protein
VVRCNTCFPLPPGHSAKSDSVVHLCRSTVRNSSLGYWRQDITLLVELLAFSELILRRRWKASDVSFGQFLLEQTRTSIRWERHKRCWAQSQSGRSFFFSTASDVKDYTTGPCRCSLPNTFHYVKWANNNPVTNTCHATSQRVIKAW